MKVVGETGTATAAFLLLIGLLTGLAACSSSNLLGGAAPTRKKRPRQPRRGR